MSTEPEVWLRGPVAGIAPALQPVAHALLQAREEITLFTKDFSENLLWIKPAGLASAGFHLQHLTGVLDRLFTYATGGSLSEDQLNYLKTEGTSPFDGCTVHDLVNRFNEQVERALAQLRTTDEGSLLQPRSVGRKQLPSTVLGLLFHAAEHTQRHTGQLLVTIKTVPAFENT